MRNRWTAKALSPAAADFGDEGRFVLLHEADESLIAHRLMGRGPQNHLGEDRSEVDSFFGEQVDEFAAVGGIGLRANDAVGFEPAEAFGEDIGCDAFGRLEELFKAAIAVQHHVAQDEQGPTVTEHFDGSVERAAGAALRHAFFVHGWRIARLACNLQVSQRLSKGRRVSSLRWVWASRGDRKNGVSPLLAFFRLHRVDALQRNPGYAGASERVVKCQGL
jgi:hypothetical protein